MKTTDSQPEDYARVARAIAFLDSNFMAQPELEDVARYVHVSPFHLQRIFKRWAGISPKRFLQVLTADFCKARLAESRSVLDAALDSGLSGPGRMHDLFVTIEAMSPGEFKEKGRGLAIRYGIHDTPFGPCLLAVTDRGICNLNFFDGDRAAAIDTLRQQWPNAIFSERPVETVPLIRRIFYRSEDSAELKIHLRASNFEAKVWKALLQIPQGAVVSYADLAAFAGCPRGSRAVGSAVARNPVGFLIPCHRVIRKSGVIGEYRWGTARKKAILAWETGQI